jgi:hypothetical protein
MRDLTPKVRAHMPKSEFAGPGTSYPVPDAAHAKLAKAMAGKFAAPALRARVDAKANAVLKGK